MSKGDTSQDAHLGLVLRPCPRNQHIKDVSETRASQGERKEDPPVKYLKESIPPAWIEVHFVVGGYYRDDKTKSFYEVVTDEKLFDMYSRRQEQRSLPRPSTYLREQIICWPQVRAHTKSVNIFVTKIYSSFQNSMNYKAILENSGDNYKPTLKTRVQFGLPCRSTQTSPELSRVRPRFQ